jgi:hypothetical protein
MSGAARLAIVDTVDPDGNEGKNGRDNSKESTPPCKPALLENDRFREDRSERHRIPRMKDLRFSKTSLETIFSIGHSQHEF